MSRNPMGSSGFAPATDPLLAADFHFVPQGVSADLIATTGNPLSDITALKRVAFVMKDGKVVRSPADGGTAATAR